MTASKHIIRVATKCQSIEEFVAAYAPHVDDKSIRVRSTKLRPAGARRRFRFELTDGTPVLRGIASVSEVSPDSPADLRLQFVALDAESRALHDRMRGRFAIGTDQRPRLVEDRSTMELNVRDLHSVRTAPIIDNRPTERVEALANAPAHDCMAAYEGKVSARLAALVDAVQSQKRTTRVKRLAEIAMTPAPSVRAPSQPRVVFHARARMEALEVPSLVPPPVAEITPPPPTTAPSSLGARSYARIALAICGAAVAIGTIAACFA